MKVTLINTADAGGGAPVACLRLLKALDEQKVDVTLLVQHKKTDEPKVEGIAKNTLTRLKAQFNFLLERLPFIFFHEKDKSVRFAFSTANVGTSIKDEPLVKDADILHLHWTNSGFLSVVDLKQLMDLGKPIVWTLHDMWTFTGGCHYAGTCDHFMRECGDCYFLSDAGPNDISHSGWLRKAAMYVGAKNITFVTCSNWLAGVAKQSSLLKDFNIKAIPNPIDTNIFLPLNDTDSHAKWCINPWARIILFGAANINDKRNGIAALTEVVIFGKNKHFDVSVLPYHVYQFDMISSQAELAELYSLAEVLVLPSLEDNLPNTAMEAMACGTPVVAFNTGGLTEMIDHQKNGYLAEFKSAADLAKGIFEILNSDKKEELSQNARNKVLRDYNNETVARQYMEVYTSALR